MRQFIEWLLLTAIVSLTQAQKIEYIRTRYRNAKYQYLADRAKNYKASC